MSIAQATAHRSRAKSPVVNLEKSFAKFAKHPDQTLALIKYGTILFCAKLLVALKKCAMFWHCLMHRSSCCVLFLMMFGVARGFVG
jgi:hypothetical protein